MIFRWAICRFYLSRVNIAGFGLFAIGAAGSLAFASADIVVSQKGRAFNPGSLEIHVGDTVTVVNDDGDLLHHAYVDAPNFTFDSGDQQPGSRISIVFNKAGSFMVLCGIHPKMKMSVQVR